jgi:hypothetical protein
MISGKHWWKTKHYPHFGGLFIINHDHPLDHNSSWCLSLTDKIGVGWHLLIFGDDYKPQ